MGAVSRECAHFLSTFAPHAVHTSTKGDGHAPRNGHPQRLRRRPRHPARAWYTDLFGLEPYFVREGGYVEWRLGPREDEFGIVDAAYAPHPTGTPAGPITFWAVDDVAAALQTLLAKGAAEHTGVREHGPGFVTASVVDPFGNVLGIMENVHFEEAVR